MVLLEKEFRWIKGRWGSGDMTTERGKEEKKIRGSKGSLT